MSNETHETPPTAWEQATDQFAQIRNARKTYTFELPDGQELTFQYRMLEEHEEDEIFGEAPIDEVDGLSEFRTDIILTGVTDGPEGFKLTRHEIAKMLPKIKKELADAIVDFSTMDEETRFKFR